MTAPDGQGWPQAPPPTARRPEPAELVGVWRRSLLAWAHGGRDTQTEVVWVQSRTWYADLRQPSGRPDFAGVGCLRDLTKRHLTWMARQQGFAGRLRRDPSDLACFTWDRLLDLDTDAGPADTGLLHLQDGILVERGRLQPYLELWHRDPGGARLETQALVLRDHACATAGLLVRVGETFAYARTRPRTLTRPSPLPELVARIDLRTAQDLLDCEVSVGRIQAGHWRIERSTLPFREGACLEPTLGDVRSGVLRTADLHPDGTPATRVWHTLRREA